jgi:hypothetical protein
VALDLTDDWSLDLAMAPSFVVAADIALRRRLEGMDERFEGKHEAACMGLRRLPLSLLRLSPAVHPPWRTRRTHPHSRGVRSQ